MMSSAGLKNIETQVKEILQHYSKEETTGKKHKRNFVVNLFAK